MAVKVMERQKNNTFATLGTLANIAGRLTGQPWLTTLGTLGNAADTLVNGETMSDEQAEKAAGGLSDLLKSMKDWFNPAKSEKEQAEEEVAALMKRWSPSLNGGYSGWPTYTGGW